MKKFKLMLTTLSIVLALSGILAPIQVVRADGPQGGSESQSRKANSSNAGAALLIWIVTMLGWKVN